MLPLRVHWSLKRRESRKYNSTEKMAPRLVQYPPNGEAPRAKPGKSLLTGLSMPAAELAWFRRRTSATESSMRVSRTSRVGDTGRGPAITVPRLLAGDHRFSRRLLVKRLSHCASQLLSCFIFRSVRLGLVYSSP